MDLRDVDLDHLLRLRLVVARFGEMDAARWWNTKGLLGQLGDLALRRGLPRSHFFAQARAVFAVAADRCRRVFDSPKSITLWKMPATAEEAFDARWPIWTEQYDRWQPFFERLHVVQGADLLGSLLDLDVVTKKEADEARTLRRAADRRAVPLAGVRTLDRRAFSLLAAGFFRGEPGEPAVPYATVEGE